MTSIFLVKPYSDGPVEVFKLPQNAILRFEDLNRQYGGTASLDELQFEEDKLAPLELTKFGPSGAENLRRR